MAKKTEQTPQDVAEALKESFANFVDTVMGGLSADGGSDDEEDEDGEWEPLDREETEALGIKELREVAKERGVEEKKKADILAALEEGGHFGEGDDDEGGEDEEDEDDEDGEDEEEGWTREDLEEYDLKALRKLAKEEGHDAAAVRGKDQDALIDLIVGDEEEDEDEDDEDESEDEETEELDEDALKAMSLKELRSLAKELEITVKVPKAKKDGKSKEKKHFIETILNSGEEG